MPKRTDVDIRIVPGPDGKPLEVVIPRLSKEEEEFLGEYQAKQQAAAANRTRRWRETVKDLNDEDLAGKLEQARARRDEMEAKRLELREAQIETAEEIAALEWQQYEREKAGWVSATIGATGSPVPGHSPPE